MIEEIKKYWKFAIISFILVMIIQLINLIPPQIMKRIIDVNIPNKNIKATYISIGLLVGIPIISNILTVFYNYILFKTIKKFSYKIRKDVFKNLLNQHIAFFNKSKVGELSSYCNQDITEFVFFWLMDIPKLLSNVLTFIVILYVLFSINLKITFISLLSIPIVIIPSLFLGKKLNKYGKTLLSLKAESNQVITESFKNIRLIKTTCSENRSINKLNNIFNKSMKIFGKTVAIENLFVNWSKEFIASVFVGICFALGALDVIRDQMSIGALIAFISYLPKLFVIITEISSSNIKLNKQLAEQEKVFEFLVMENEYDNESTINPTELKGNIVFKDVSFRYPDTEKFILKNTNLNINAGTFNIIIGKSGVGKSTIFDLLIRFYDVSSGKILLDNNDINYYPKNYLRNSVFLVSQDILLFSGTIRDNLLLANPNSKEKEMYEVLEQVNLIELINSLPNKLDTELGENGVLLSGGEKQRIAIAMGLLKGSKILLLDEVSSNLDIESEKYIHKTIKNIIDKNKITVISITHKINNIYEADKIFLVENQTIKEVSNNENVEILLSSSSN